MVLRAPAVVLEELRALLLGHSPREAAAFLSAEPSGDELVLRDVRAFTAEEMTDRGGELTLHEDVQARELARIKRAGHALVEVHTHPGAAGPVQFSSLDDVELGSFARYVSHKLPGRPFGALVLGQTGYAGRTWIAGAAEDLFVEPVGERAMTPMFVSRRTRPRASDDERYDRQIRGLGTRGQALVAGLRIGVVGVGGTGSVAVQQLAHLGVRSFVLVDDDRVEPTNLPRLTGASCLDAKLRRRKTAVARRLIRRVAGRRAGLTVIATGDLRTLESLKALRGVDLIVGCVDNDGARIVMTELAAAHLVPYLDIGVGMENDSDGAAVMGGRVGFFLPGGPCLRCADEIDEAEAAEDLSPKALRELRVARGYAADRRIEPALMPLNSSVASLAMIEFLAFATGVRAVEPFSRYDALRGRITRLRVERDPDCTLCVAAHGMGDRQSVDRYLG
jgi:molybdopterin/thiamine biosynthesis adenylyltransferase